MSAFVRGRLWLTRSVGALDELFVGRIAASM